MGIRDKRVDAYITRVPEFARPVLMHIRDLVHEACPAVEEDIKWGCPHFVYKGLMCSMAAFKSHCVMGFTKSSLLPDPDGILERQSEKTAMGQLGRMTCLEDLPEDRVILEYVKSAAALNDAGIKRSFTSSRSARRVRTPAFFRAALRKHPTALKMFENFTASQKRGYVEWLTEAKTDETRRRRLNTAIKWIAEGRKRNWKYMKR